jgi:hypothetical protein
MATPGLQGKEIEIVSGDDAAISLVLRETPHAERAALLSSVVCDGLQSISQTPSFGLLGLALLSRSALRDADSDIRRAALSGLSLAKPSLYQFVSNAALFSPEESIREDALIVAAKTGFFGIVEASISADVSESIRELAKDLASSLETRKAEPVIDTYRETEISGVSEDRFIRAFGCALFEPDLEAKSRCESLVKESAELHAIYLVTQTMHEDTISAAAALQALGRSHAELAKGVARGMLRHPSPVLSGLAKSICG